LSLLEREHLLRTIAEEEEALSLKDAELRVRELRREQAKLVAKFIEECHLLRLRQDRCRLRQVEREIAALEAAIEGAKP
jgi:hypothetical protein